MTERRPKFRQQELTRALRAARAAGLEISGYEIDPVSGKRGRVKLRVLVDGVERELGKRN